MPDGGEGGVFRRIDAECPEWASSADDDESAGGASRRLLLSSVALVAAPGGAVQVAPLAARLGRGCGGLRTRPIDDSLALPGNAATPAGGGVDTKPFEGQGQPQAISRSNTHGIERGGQRILASPETGERLRALPGEPESASEIPAVTNDRYH